MEKCKQVAKKNTISRILTVCVIPILIAVCLLSILSISTEQHAYAGGLRNCLSESGASSVESVQTLCESICPKAASSKKFNAFGTMWFNDSSTNKDSDIINAQDSTNENMTVYLWGQIYNCGGGETGKQEGLYIWFAEEGQMIGDTVGGNKTMPHKVDFIKNNDATATLSRGGPCSDNSKDCPGYYWFSPINNRIPITLNVPAFIEYAKQKNKCEGADDNNIKCTVKVSVNRCYSNKNNGYLNTTNNRGTTTCYGDDSTITVVTGNPPDKPDEPDPEEGGAEFYSKSYASSTDENAPSETAGSAKDGKLSNDDPPIVNADEYAGEAGFLAYEISIDSETDVANLTFWHKMFYEVTKEFGTYDKADDITTDWEIKTRIKRRPGKTNKTDATPSDGGWEALGQYDKSGSFTPSSSMSSDESDLLPEGKLTVNVNLNEGETALVCSRISYEPKNVSFTVDHHIHDSDDDHLGYYYSVSGDGDGYSEACILVHRQAKPGGSPWSGAKGGGDLSSQPMYAGEHTDIGWDVWTEGSRTSRIKMFQAVNYVMPVDANKDNGDLKGKTKEPDNGRGTRTICEFYKGVRKNLSDLCTGVEEYSMTYTTNYVNDGGNEEYLWHEMDRSVLIVPPNEVGRKHANTGGYKFEVWECVPNKDAPGCHWEHFSEKDYWYIYNTAARTIAKKPSVAFWNSGLFANGDISTSLAGRHTIGDNYGRDAVYVTETEVRDTKTYFGSWSEYLATVGGVIDSNTGLTSGTILAAGLHSLVFSIVDNSPLTISNRTGSSDTVGNSGLSNDTILRQRLQDYFFSREDLNVIKLGGGTEASDISELSDSISKTVIISVDGDFDIDKNIKLSNDAQLSIYTLPQVLIYASGDIKVGSSVEQIDAWLIAGGSLNTCSNFADNKEKTSAHITIDSYSTTLDLCSNSLTINGPVIANNVKLNRSYGADGISNGDQDLAGSSDARAASAEVFNLSADSYLWAYAQSGRYSSSYSEAYSRELPPRY